MDSLTILDRAIQQLEETFLVPGPVAGEELRAWRAFQARVHALHSEYARQISDARSQGFAEGHQAGVILASHHLFLNL